MAKENSKAKDWYKSWWVILIAIGLLLWSFGFLSNPFSGESELKRDYKVTDFFCTQSAYVDMVSSGNREDQVISGLIYLYEDCPDLSSYHVTITESTRECLYSLNGEVVKYWYEGIGEENQLISEESKRIIENDIGFTLWKSQAKYYFEFESMNGISDMTIQQMSLSGAYKDYLENGITRTTIYSIIHDYEINGQFNCE